MSEKHERLKTKGMETSTAIHEGFSTLETKPLDQIYTSTSVMHGMASQLQMTDPMLGSRTLGFDVGTQPGQQTLNQLSRGGRPFIEILEQPRSRGLRFRYKCEGRSAGTIPGESSTNENRVYPTIKICNYTGPSAIVVVSCVTKDDPPRPHPHSLVGKDCKQGVCTVKLKGTTQVSFPSLGIQCATKREIQDALKQREKIRVDPWGTGYYKNINSIELSTVRLAFQAFLPDDNGKYTRIVQPIVSHCIYDKKAVTDLVICRLSKQSGNVKGGDEVFLLCEKVTKDDIQVRFFEENKDEGVVRWEKYGIFGQQDVHRQVAIVFKTPEYREQGISQPVTVMMQLRRPSDDEVSDPKPFQYIPNDPDPDCVGRKRKRKTMEFDNFLKDYNVPDNYNQYIQQAPVSVKETIKERLIKKVNRNPGPIPNRMQETGAAGSEHFQLQHYSLDNTGGVQPPPSQHQQIHQTMGIMQDSQSSSSYPPVHYQSPPPLPIASQYQTITSTVMPTTDGMIMVQSEMQPPQEITQEQLTSVSVNPDGTMVETKNSDLYALLAQNMGEGGAAGIHMTSLPSLPSAMYDVIGHPGTVSENLAILQEDAVQVAAEETVESMNEDSPGATGHGHLYANLNQS